MSETTAPPPSPSAPSKTASQEEFLSLMLDLVADKPATQGEADAVVHALIEKVKQWAAVPPQPPCGRCAELEARAAVALAVEVVKAKSCWGKAKKPLKSTK
jgi:hypothetical protein